MNDILGQLRDQWLSVGVTFVVLAISGAAVVFWFFYRRDIQRDDSFAGETKDKLEKHGDSIADHETRITVLEKVPKKK